MALYTVQAILTVIMCSNYDATFRNTHHFSVIALSLDASTRNQICSEIPLRMSLSHPIGLDARNNKQLYFMIPTDHIELVSRQRNRRIAIFV